MISSVPFSVRQLLTCRRCNCGASAYWFGTFCGHRTTATWFIFFAFWRRNLDCARFWFGLPPPFWLAAFLLTDGFLVALLWLITHAGMSRKVYLDYVFNGPRRRMLLLLNFYFVLLTVVFLVLLFC